ncbi:MAG: sensor histidine kinase [Bacteroidota bacterium]
MGRYVRRLGILLIAVLGIFRVTAQTGDYADPVADSLLKKYRVTYGMYPDSGILLLDQMIARFKVIGEEKELSNAYFRKSFLLFITGKEDASLKLIDKGIKHARKFNDSLVIGKFYGSLTSFYLHTFKDTKSAQKYHEEHRKYIKPTDSLVYAFFLQDGAQICNVNKDFKKSDELLETSLRYGIALNNIGVQTEAYHMLGSNALETHQCEKVAAYIEKAIDLDQQLGNTQGLINCNYYLAGMMIDCYNNPQKALEYLEKTRKYSAESGITLQPNVLESHVRAYEKLGDYRNALLYLRMQQAAKDTLLLKEKAEEFNRLEARYQSELKETQIRNLKQEEKEHKTTARTAIVALALAVGLLIAVGIAYRNRSRLNRFNREENQRKELLLEEVHHRINNSLQITGALLSMQERSAIGDEAKELLRQAGTRIHTMSTMHGMLNSSKSVLDLQMKPYLGSILEFHRTILNDDGAVCISTDIEDALFPAKFALPLGLIVNELVTNAIKYAFPDRREGNVSVNLSQESPHNWVLAVTDDGIGMGSDNPSAQKGGKFGLRVVQILTRQLKGTFTVVAVSRGARFELRFVA